MRIAQISPLMEAIPPKFYGGTERIVAYLTDELVAIRDHVALLIVMLETVARRADEFDLVHLHCDYLGYSALRRACRSLQRCAAVSTCPNSSRSTACSPMCRWSRSRTPSVSLCPRRATSPRYRMACQNGYSWRVRGRADTSP